VRTARKRTRFCIFATACSACSRVKPLGRFSESRRSVTTSEKVEVTRGAERVGNPDRDEHRALQDEAVRICRDRQAIEETLQREARQDEVEALAARLGEVQEALANRGAEVRGSLLQDSASR
jgi:hypothetical protein